MHRDIHRKRNFQHGVLPSQITSECGRQRCWKQETGVSTPLELISNRKAVLGLPGQIGHVSGELRRSLYCCGFMVRWRWAGVKPGSRLSAR